MLFNILRPMMMIVGGIAVIIGTAIGVIIKNTEEGLNITVLGVILLFLGVVLDIFV